MDNANEIIFTSDQLQKRIAELAAAIDRDYADIVAPLVAVCLLKGAILFYSDLVRRLNVPVLFDFMLVSSYGTATESSGRVTVTKDLEFEVKDRHVLLIDDIVDSGRTMATLKELVGKRGPRSLKTCCLLDKPSRRAVPLAADYVGFTIPDRFVYGYGLDDGQMSRQLPFIVVKNS